MVQVSTADTMASAPGCILPTNAWSTSRAGLHHQTTAPVAPPWAVPGPTCEGEGSSFCPEPTSGSLSFRTGRLIGSPSGLSRVPIRIEGKRRKERLPRAAGHVRRTPTTWRRVKRNERVAGGVKTPIGRRGKVREGPLRDLGRKRARGTGNTTSYVGGRTKLGKNETTYKHVSRS